MDIPHDRPSEARSATAHPPQDSAQGSAYRPCVVCGHHEPSFMYTKNGFSIVRCTQCDFVFVGEALDRIDFNAVYGESYYTGGSPEVFANYLGEEQARRASARRRVWGLRLTQGGGRLLDVGCAAGFFLAEARRFYQVQGVEFSEYSSRFAREHFGLDVFTGTLPQARLPAGQFDLITMWDVIEHVPDPDVVLAEAARLLKPNGRLIVTTGDIDSRYAQQCGAAWPLMGPPWHLYYFSRATMASLCAKVGLRVVHCGAQGVVADGRFWQSRPVVALSNLFGQGDIMQMTLARTHV